MDGSWHLEDQVDGGGVEEVEHHAPRAPRHRPDHPRTYADKICVNRYTFIYVYTYLYTIIYIYIHIYIYIFMYIYIYIDR